MGCWIVSYFIRPWTSVKRGRGSVFHVGIRVSSLKLVHGVVNLLGGFTEPQY